MKKVFCDLNPDYFVNGSCKVKPIKRYVSVFNIKATLIKAMETVWVRMKLLSVKILKHETLLHLKIRVKFFHKTSMTFQPFIVNFFADYCTFREGNANNQLMNMLIISISRYSNNTHPCPFLPPEEFILKDFIFSLDILPPIIPTAEYRIDIEYLMDESASVRYALIQNFVTLRALNLVDQKMGWKFNLKQSMQSIMCCD